MSLLVALALAGIHGQDKSPGSIELTGDAGVEVFLDDVSIGTTGKEPYAIPGVAPGSHKLKLVKEGYHPLEIDVLVEPGKKCTPKLGPFKPDVKFSQSDDEPSFALRDKTGWVIIRSHPVDCEISCGALGIETAKKSRPLWSAFHIPPGRYTIRFAAGGKHVDHEIEFRPGSKTFLSVSIDEARVAVDQGEILVKCEAGVEIRVDDRVAGTTVQDGLLVRDVSPGPHKIVAKKFGYKAVEESVEVQKGKTEEVSVRTYNFKPEVLIFEDGKEPDPSTKGRMWKLVVRSQPIECRVSCSDLELEKASKISDRWTAYGVLEKRFSFNFATADGSLYCDLKLTVGKTTVAMVYFADRRVEVDRGDLGVKTGPGAAVFVDGIERGKTADSGLVVRDLIPGMHAVKVVMPDFQTQETTLEVVAGESAEFPCKPFIPILQITESEEEADPKFAARGTLFLRTRPMACSIDCALLGLEKVAKTADPWIAYGVPPGSYELAFTSGGTRVAYRAEFKSGRRVRLEVDLASGTVSPIPAGAADFVLVAQHRVHEKAVLSTRVFPDARLAVSAGLDPWIRFWDLQTRMEFDTFPIEEGAHDLALSADGKLLYVLHTDSITVWDFLKRKRVRRVERPKGERALRIVSSGKAVALAIYGDRPNRNALVLVDPVTWKDVLSIPVHEVLSEVDCLALSPDGQSVAWSQHESKIRLWGADGKQGRTILSFHKANVRGLAFSADGKTLASFGEDSNLRLWDPATGRSVRTLDSKTKPEVVAWSPDGKCIAAGDIFGHIRIWSLPEGKLVRSLHDFEADVRALNFSPDGKTLLCGGMIERRSDSCPRGYGVCLYHMSD